MSSFVVKRSVLITRDFPSGDQSGIQLRERVVGEAPQRRGLEVVHEEIVEPADETRERDRIGRPATTPDSGSRQSPES